jgi:hypothetical protein
MFVKKIKRKCDVRGCKNIADVYLISKRRDMSNTIAMCRDCMKEALSATEGYTEPIKAKKEVKPLFPHPELDVTISSVADVEPEPPEVIEEVAEEYAESVAEDTVTIEEEPITTTTKPEVVLPAEATQTNGKKKKSKK